MKTLVVLNPMSAGGKTLRRWRTCEPVFRDAGFEYAVHQTVARGDATDAVRRALADGGVQRIVSVGGDGTLNEVVNGFFDSEGHAIRDNAQLGVIPSGTGGDFRRTAGIPGASPEAARVIAAGTVQRVDVGRVDFGDGARRFFVNIADCGIGGEVVRRVNRSRFKGGGARGSAVFLWTSLRTLLSFGGRQASVACDDETIEGVVHNVVVANGQFFGGGMHVAPRAALDDGLFDVVVITATSRTRAVAGIPSLYRGTHLERSDVTWRRSRVVRIESAGPPLLFDIEGEEVGQTPATITCLPAAITLCVPPRVTH